MWVNPQADIPFLLHQPKNPKRYPKLGLSCYTLHSIFGKLSQSQNDQYDQVFFKPWSRTKKPPRENPNQKPRVGNFSSKTKIKEKFMGKIDQKHRGLKKASMLVVNKKKMKGH